MKGMKEWEDDAKKMCRYFECGQTQEEKQAELMKLSKKKRC